MKWVPDSTVKQKMKVDTDVSVRTDVITCDQTIKVAYLKI